MKRPKPVALIILDGWGLNPEVEYNAIARADAPFQRSLFSKYPHAALLTSGEAVGLPGGQMGTSEVGHTNIGAGRVVYQSLVRISVALRDGELKRNPVLLSFIEHVKKNRSAAHFMGLVSPGGVHSHTEHLYGLLQICRDYDINEVYIHAFLDGRDTPPASAGEYLMELEQECARIGIGKIATVSGRYYAMDRDKRWERVEKAYRAMVDGVGNTGSDPVTLIRKSYEENITDEFVIPSVIVENGHSAAAIKPEDAVIFFNFRPDRAREITRAFVDPDFNGFKREKGYLGVKFICMTQYDELIDAPVLFPPEGRLANIFGEVLSEHGLTQLRIAETEKYAHVTFFFNGGEELEFPGETRILIPSPKVPTYDLKPEMSAIEVTDAVCAEIAADKFDVIVMNYANCDMVGHTGVMEATIKAVEAVDKCLARVVPAVLGKGGICFICADHGNAELMRDEHTGSPYTAHTTYPTPCILAGAGEGIDLRDGILADIAPTLLELMGIPRPREMTGKSLLKEKNKVNPTLADQHKAF